MIMSQRRQSSIAEKFSIDEHRCKQNENHQNHCPVPQALVFTQQHLASSKKMDGNEGSFEQIKDQVALNATAPSTQHHKQQQIVEMQNAPYFLQSATQTVDGPLCIDQVKVDGEVFSKAYSRLNRWEN